MGKPEVESQLCNDWQRNLIHAKCKCNNNENIHPFESEDISSEVPETLQIFSNQVAGHLVHSNGQYVGLLKQNGFVFKPVLKKDLGEREVHFYKSLSESVDRTLIDLKNLVPAFYGTQKVTLLDEEFDCIILEDLTQYYKEPCIMDIKIGKRAWDPNAAYVKIIAEENKYRDCRRDLGFCIPGFQVYSVANKQLSKYGKDFGKSLNKERAIDAIKAFLNYDKGFCRSLIMQFLAALWRIQNWARNQRRFRLFSSSILLVYDARRLRENMPCDNIDSPKMTRKSSLYRPMSIATLNSSEHIPTGFSGLLTKEGPILKLPTCSNKLVNLEVPVCMRGGNSWQKSIHTLKRTHSFQNNYDKDVQNKKQNYLFILDELSTDQNSECWAAAKMIDFAHVYPGENCSIDENYLNGIDNLVKIFEDFLDESV